MLLSGCHRATVGNLAGRGTPPGPEEAGAGVTEHGRYGRRDRSGENIANEGRAGVWIYACAALLLVSLSSNASPALAVLFHTSSVQIGWPWVILPVLVAHLIAHRLVPAWRAILEAVSWLAWWLALPVVLADVFGMDAARNVSWLLLMGAAEITAAILVWRLLRNWEMRHRDPTRVAIGRSPGLLGDRVWLPGADRFLHVQVLGPTGSGKTRSVLSPMLAQDLADSGRGSTVLDPKGDFADFAIAELERLGRPYQLLRPGDPRGGRLNPMDGTPSESAETVVYAFDRAFPDGHPFYRPLGQNLVRYSVRALVEARPGSGLDDLRRFLLDDDFRLEILTHIDDTSVRGYFRDVFSTWPARTRAEYTAGVINTLLGLLGEPSLVDLFRPPATVNLDTVLAEGQVLVVDLPVGTLGAGAGLAGAFVLSTLQRAALKRENGGAAHMLYVDEFGTFAPGGFAEFLALARSKRVGAVLAHQHIAQLEPTLRTAVEANARSRVVLGGVSAADAEAIAREALAGPGAQRTLVQELRGLPRGQAIALLTVNGSLTPPRRVLLPNGPGRATGRRRTSFATADA